jgi:hypothetical protein
MSLRLLLAVMLVAPHFAPRAFAEVVHVRDYQSPEPTDQNVLFAFAVTPGQDAISLVPKRDGKWRLTRIRGWFEKNPRAQTIDVPGWQIQKTPSPNVQEVLENIAVGLFVTPDGKYAVCGGCVLEIRGLRRQI